MIYTERNHYYPAPAYPRRDDRHDGHWSRDRDTGGDNRWDRDRPGDRHAGDRDWSPSRPRDNPGREQRAATPGNRGLLNPQGRAAPAPTPRQAPRPSPQRDDDNKGRWRRD